MNYTTKNDDADTKTADVKGDELVVLAGSVQVKRQVGAGYAIVDVTQGEPVGEIDDETRERYLKSGAIGRRDGDPYVAPGRVVPAEVEPDEIDTDVIPGGSIEQVMAWVGDDLARARVARDMELAKGLKARAALIKKLDEVKVSTETEPPEIPEAYDGSIQPTPAGGVATPVDDSAVADKPASEAPASKRTRS